VIDLHHGGVVALAADAGLTWLERWLRSGRRTPARLAPLALAAAVLLAVSLLVVSASGDPARIVVASKNFTEQVVLGELVAQSLERDGLAVTRRLNLGGTFICDRALRAGDVDVYAEYTGTALTAIFKEPVTGARDAVLSTTRARYAAAGVTVLPPLGFDNTFAILVRKTDAATLGLKTIGDLRRVPASWQPGFGFEFLERQDGYRGLAAAYGLSFAQPPRAMDLSLMYRALAAGDVDVIAGDATSALIDALDLVMLKDDRSYFPPYDAIAVVRTPTLLRRPEVGRALERLTGQVTVQGMRAMNRAVDVDRRNPADVVRDFLKRH
jgi:glycine betaine/choline ABC-type transport system substrate-binding protein